MHPVTLIPRHLTEKLASTLRTTRVINIVGPRQTGKTTLVRDMVEAARFLDLDDESLFASLALDPYGQRREEAFIVEVKRSEEHTSELQSRLHLVCRLLLEQNKRYSIS